MKPKLLTDGALDIHKWCHEIVEGVGGMNDFEKYEMVVWNVPDRVAAVMYALRCLANPNCEGAAEVLEAIIERRKGSVSV